MSNNDRINILFFLPDQHRRDWTGFDPSLDIQTPNLDSLAARGTRFTRAYTPSPLCAPARACLASGQGYRECQVPSNQQNYPLDQPTYYQRLRDNGYRVGGVGKFDLHKATLDWNLDGSRLLDEWGFTDGIDNEGKLDGSISFGRAGKPMGPYLSQLDRRGVARAYCEEHARIRDTKGAYTTIVDDESYCDNWVAENGLRTLQDFPTDSPWHLVVNFTGPHGPMDITESMARSVEGRTYPEPYGTTSGGGYSGEDHQRNRRNYVAMIENIDRQMGRFLDLVESRGETDRTFIVYSSDHGEMLGDHDRWGKSTWQEPSVGIPFVVAPAPVMGCPADRDCSSIVSLHDLTSTFIDVAGAKPLLLDSRETSSRSLMPVLTGETGLHRSYGTSALDGSPGRSVGWRMAVDERFKLVETSGNDEEPERYMLFDLDDDPEELNDILNKQPDIVSDLKELLP